jgi:hypothetical protein
VGFGNGDVRAANKPTALRVRCVLGM